MSQPKMSARASAVWSWAPAAATASNSELSMTPRTVRIVHLERVLHDLGREARSPDRATP